MKEYITLYVSDNI